MVCDYEYDVAKVQPAMMAMGWTMDQLAREAHVARNTIMKVFRGEQVRPAPMKRLADALGLDLAELVVEVGQEVA